ncbi:uncharacterized protein LOC136087907 [Hydra vulgaris]|uniref:Uncharacterized protein LOC136087907 n=1 Tax=Hydra vulgaris TaxID=6087 RepID=A0ABM4D073_HYDVU
MYPVPHPPLGGSDYFSLKTIPYFSLLTISNKDRKSSTILEIYCLTSLQIEENNKPIILKEYNDSLDNLLQETFNLLDCGNEELKIIEKDSLQCQNVLFWLMNITLYLVADSMTFRGSSDKLFTPKNGEFLGLIQMLTKFDPAMQNHLAFAMKGGTSDHYCRKHIQNELTDLMSQRLMIK